MPFSAEQKIIRQHQKELNNKYQDKLKFSFDQGNRLFQIPLTCFLLDDEES